MNHRPNRLCHQTNTSLTRQRGEFPCRGSVLLLVLVAITIMTLATGSYLALMRNEHLATRYSGHHQQVRMLAESGVEYLRIFLSQTDDQIRQQGGLLSNPSSMQGVLVDEDVLPTYQGSFTVLAPDLVQGYYSDIRYGLENESARLNLNTLVGNDDQQSNAARQRLLAIPGMEASTADAILDWLDADNKPREFGAEASAYESLDPAYQPRNGPLAALDELLMVQGVTAELLHGLDTNRNFTVDAEEDLERQPRGALQTLDNSNGQLNRGWSAYLTLHSLERVVNPEGKQKININSDNLKTLYDQLRAVIDDDKAKFIIAYRQYGAAAEGATGQSTDISALKLDLKKKPAKQLASMLDLIGVQVSVQKNQKAQPKIIESPWKDDAATYRQDFLKLLDQVAESSAKRIAGRTNINQASRPVLLSIPKMTEQIADQILNRRETAIGLLDGPQRHAVWILTEGIVSLKEMKQIDPYVTTRGDVYRGQVVGYFESATPKSRIEVLLDRSGTKARLLGWRDLSMLGPGFTRDVLGE